MVFRKWNYVSHVITSSYNHSVNMRTHRWLYGPCYRYILQLVCGHCIFCGYCPLGLGSSALCTMSLKVFFQSIDFWRLLFAQVNHGVRSEELREVGWDYMGVTWPWLCSWWHSSETVHWRTPWFLPLCGMSHHPTIPRKHFNYFAYIWPNYVLLHILVCRIVNQNS